MAIRRLIDTAELGIRNGGVRCWPIIPIPKNERIENKRVTIRFEKWFQDVVSELREEDRIRVWGGEIFLHY
jgi:hypothetical protein